MQITRTEPASGSPERTPREELKPLFTGKRGVEPEQYVDVSPSNVWVWDGTQGQTTWAVLVPSVKAFTEPFALMDTEAANETEAGGVATYPFSDTYVKLSDQLDEDGEPIIDVNPANFDERWAHFLRIHPDYFVGGKPKYGGTDPMTAIRAGDEHFMDEFGERPRAQRPVRARILWTDGVIPNSIELQQYLSQATEIKDNDVSDTTILGSHGDWDEAWIVAIFGPEGGDGRQAYEQYVQLAKTHPWIHPVYFSGVTNHAEVAEDIAYLAVPTQG